VTGGLRVAGATMLPAPPLDLTQKIHQFGTTGGEAVVGAVIVVVVLHEFLIPQVGQRVGQRLVVHNPGTCVRHGVVELGVAQRAILEGRQDGDVQFPVSQQVQ